MRRFKRILTILTLSSIALFAVACDKQDSGDTAAAEATAEAPAEITVEELSMKIDKKEDVTICDANNADTRKEHGVIPGAVLMSSYEDLSVLPENKDASLVFYCGSEKCSAAPKAAEKALSQGYKDVKVLKAGIKGWTSAGKATEKKG